MSSNLRKAVGRVSRKQPKHKDYILAQWPDDLDTNTTTLATPYLCCTCSKPCKSITSLRTHKCQGARKKESV